MTKLAAMRVLQRKSLESSFSGPLVTVLFLPELPCALGMQAAHLAVTQQQITMCTAGCWALPLLLGAKVLHGVGTKLGVLVTGPVEQGCARGVPGCPGVKAAVAVLRCADSWQCVFVLHSVHGL